MTQDIKTTIARLREEMAKADQGEWDTHYYNTVVAKDVIVCKAETKENAIFIADAHDSLPAILDALEEAMRKSEAGERLANSLLFIGLQDDEEDAWQDPSRMQEIYVEQIAKAKVSYDEATK